jgi:hypothetical protein
MTVPGTIKTLKVCGEEMIPLTAQTVQWEDSCCIPGSLLAPCQVLFWRKLACQMKRNFMSESSPLLSVTSHCCHSWTGTSNPEPRLATWVAVLGCPVCQLRRRVHGCVERVEGRHWVGRNINSDSVIYNNNFGGNIMMSVYSSTSCQLSAINQQYSFLTMNMTQIINTRFSFQKKVNEITNTSIILVVLFHHLRLLTSILLFWSQKWQSYLQYQEPNFLAIQ